MKQKEIDLIRLQCRRNDMLMFLRDGKSLNAQKAREKIREWNKQINSIRKQLRKEI